VIKSFADRHTLTFWETGKSKGVPPANLRKKSMRSLLMLDAATLLKDLEAPPGNRLEPLKGDRAGQHSIRINDQFRVCFRWENNDAYDVEIIDYH
jgi:proteic killer suppression protein